MPPLEIILDLQVTANQNMTINPCSAFLCRVLKPLETFFKPSLVFTILTSIMLFLEASINLIEVTAQKMKFYIKDFFSKCDQIRSFLLIWSHLLKRSLMENFIFLCSECVLSFKQDQRRIFGVIKPVHQNCSSIF